MDEKLSKQDRNSMSNLCTHHVIFFDLAKMHICSFTSQNSTSKMKSIMSKYSINHNFFFSSKIISFKYSFIIIKHETIL